MTLLKLSLAALVGTAIGAGTSLDDPPAGRIPPTATTVLVQAPAGHGVRPGAPPVLPEAARRLAARGADVTVVYGAADATSAVIRAAGTYSAVLGVGPDVRVALALAAPDHPGTRFTPLR